MVRFLSLRTDPSHQKPDDTVVYEQPAQAQAQPEQPVQENAEKPEAEERKPYNPYQ